MSDNKINEEYPTILSSSMEEDYKNMTAEITAEEKQFLNNIKNMKLNILPTEEENECENKRNQKSCYNGFVSLGLYQFFKYNIETLDYRMEEHLGLETNRVVLRFLYDMYHLDRLISLEKSNDFKIILKSIRKRCINEITNKWEKIKSNQTFQDHFYIASLLKEKLKVYIPNCEEFLQFTDNYFLNKSFSSKKDLNFCSEEERKERKKILIESTQKNIEPFFEDFYNHQQTNNLFLNLIKFLNETLILGISNISNIYYFNNEDLKSPKIYKLKKENFFEQIKLIYQNPKIENIYIEIDNKFMIIQNDSILGIWDIIYAIPPKEFINDGEYYKSNLYSNNLILL